MVLESAAQPVASVHGISAKYAIWHILSAVYKHYVRVAPEMDVNNAVPVTLALHRRAFLVP